MTTATVRQLRDVLEPSPRMRRAEVPANSVPDTSHSMDVRTVQNWLNRLPDGWNSPQSPDELVIQKRGRRKSIVWSPDLNTYKRRSLLSLSSKDHTPIKNPSTSNMALRDAARKRLSLGDTNQSKFPTPKSKKILSSRMSLDAANMLRQRSKDNLVNGLRNLSHEQLVQLIMELVYAQEDGTLCENEKLRYILSKKISDGDIQPFIEKLILLKQNIYANPVFSPNLNDELAYSCAYMHLDAYQKALIDQGRILQESQHWISLMHYVLEAWKITRELPKWENQDCNITHKCFQSLSQFCAETIRRGNFDISTLEIYIESLKIIVEECEDFQICLQIAKEAKHEA
ncbi:hypothetical protein EAG_08031 [Camponotus floridanus]|uniref:Uncharacterized protein n=2 Tax=Camponotus floridanus TaxID=104421 RepID=E2AIH0_CAMFO|nr:uncharacterized protein LOC105252761 isoform X1 [Camponotus floridanus]EFN66760.1 hypothetical protein EAG_08031 [Camponotus floridanus]